MNFFGVWHYFQKLSRLLGSMGTQFPSSTSVAMPVTTTTATSITTIATAFYCVV